MHVPLFQQALLGLVCIALATISTAAPTSSACQKLAGLYGINPILPSQSSYGALSTENCQNTPFAIRSGGHMPSPLAANINDGVLIDMSMFKEVSYDAAKKAAKIGAGQRWGDVYSRLDPYGVTIVGGRVLDVGVGGLILGCGLSYLSDLHGLACDNVINFEVVLANGSIVDANEKSNPDLWWALKGGGNNFGIVTSFTLSTYPIHDVWGGSKAYSLDQLPALFSAMNEYQWRHDKDPYANLILQAFTTNASIGAFVNMVYLKPELSPPAFSPFYSIPTVGDTTKLQTLTQMISGQIVPSLPRVDWLTTTFKPGSSAYTQIASIMGAAPELQSISSVESGSFALAHQPIDASAIHAGNQRGGNALGLQAERQTWFAFDTAHWRADNDKAVHSATQKLHAKVESITKKDGSYLPYLFMNDASYDQDVIGHYGAANVQRLKAVQARYDPDLVFQKLVPGGFKLP
ncbi:MAG: hypothetical protein LQ350_007230 [Teloschistes chrysophthalmus]|nr:MAG: hypothetical protein LQ350_007230 [Niorma chrysophthalma]